MKQQRPPRPTKLLSKKSQDFPFQTHNAFYVHLDLTAQLYTKTKKEGKCQTIGIKLKQKSHAYFQNLITYLEFESLEMFLHFKWDGKKKKNELSYFLKKVWINKRVIVKQLLKQSQVWVIRRATCDTDNKLSQRSGD